MITKPFSISLSFLALSVSIGVCRTPGMAQTSGDAQTKAASRATRPPLANDQVTELVEKFAGKGVMADDSEPTSPRETLKTFRPAEGLTIDLIANEPVISQPLFLSWDSRGRMWVVQYRQYQYPAGLKVVKFDQYLRAVFDKTPEPPPRGVRGLDTITVLEDADDDGVYESHKDVLTGLNIATSVQVGAGGIWVLNPPYLLFYPDANGDDVPDGDPEVRLSGFGLQDTHSVANSLTWGPDGWLYGANGSTTGGTVSSEVTKGVRFEGQCIWRYHPTTKVFEIYAEGGGNTFSLEIDSKGRVFSGTNGGSTRGFHYPQGAYFHKNWGKHGPLTNPHALGFFQPMPMKGDTRRFAQAFTIYESDLFPEDYRGDIFAPNSLHNVVWHSELIPDGSTYRTEDNANALETSDRWFRPVFCGVGPDGGVYLADWYDTRLSHVSPIDDWHKESGRIYRLRPNEAKPKPIATDLHSMDAESLLALLDEPNDSRAANKWLRQRAVLEIGWRGEVGLTKDLVRRVDKRSSLESLWALHQLGAITSSLAKRWLHHDDEHIRRWMVRLIGDGTIGETTGIQGSDVLAELAVLAKSESAPQVLSQLASTAKRLPSREGLAVWVSLLPNVNLDDPHLPLLMWWALEAHAGDWQAVSNTFQRDDVWKSSLVQKEILHRLMQRYATSAEADDLKRAESLLDLAPSDEISKQRLLSGLNQAFQGRRIPELPQSLDRALRAYQQARGDAGLADSITQSRPEGIQRGVAILRDAKQDTDLRIAVAKAFGQAPANSALESLLALALGRAGAKPALQRVAIRSLAAFDSDTIATRLIGGFYSSISAEHELRDTACRTLASRASSARVLVEEVNEWRLRVNQVPADVVQQLRTYEQPELVAAVERAFGKPDEISSPEKAAKIRKWMEILNAGTGDADAGEAHYAKRCGICHKLFGKGESIGPPLDGYDRGNAKFWLTGIVEPSLEIREGFQSYKALTNDGRVVTGMVDAQTPQSVTLRTADNQRVVLSRDDLEVIEPIKTSLMPEGALDDFTDQQFRDLMAYLALGTKR